MEIVLMKVSTISRFDDPFFLNSFSFFLCLTVVFIPQISLYNAGLPELLGSMYQCSWSGLAESGPSKT